MHIIVPGPIPSKKNSRICFVKHGKMINIPSKDYTLWHRRSGLVLAPQLLCQPMLDKCESIQIDFYVPDNRGRDLTNMAEGILDLLVDCAVILDDKWQVVGQVILCAKGIDKENPRAEVFIST